LSRLKGLLRRAEGKPGTYGADYDDEKREKKRGEKKGTYESIRDGDVPKVAATDFADDNNVEEKGEEKRQGLISNTIT